MSDTQDQHDQLRDRLTDQVLREILSGDTPPDLTDSIVAASKQSGIPSAGVKPMSRRRTGRQTWWLVLTTAASLAVIAAVTKAPEYLRQRRSVATVQTLDTSDRAATIVTIPSGAEPAMEALFGAATEDDAPAPVDQFVGKQLADNSVSANSPSLAVQPSGPDAVARQAMGQPLQFGLPPGIEPQSESAFGGDHNSIVTGTQRSADYYKGPVPQSGQSGAEVAGVVVTGDTGTRSSAGSRYGGYGDGSSSLDRREYRVAESKGLPGDGRATPILDAFNTDVQLVESMPAPHPDNPPISYPDAQEWEELSNRRRARYSQFDLGQKTDSAALSDAAAVTSRLAVPGLQPSTAPDPSSAASHWVLRGTSGDAAPVQLGDIGIRGGRANEVAVEFRVKRQSLIRGEIKQLAQELHTDSERLATTFADDGTIPSLDRKLARISQLQQEYTRLEAEGNRIGQGQGPGNSGDQYQRIYENPFVVAQGEDAVATFSIDVDTASYTNVRQFLLGHGQLPPPDAVRIEELVNYFDYAYQPPVNEKPFAASIEVAGCPWEPKHRLVRVGIKGREIDNDERPDSNLVFLVDVSGSMNQSNKLPLVVEGLQQLTRELTDNDRVAIVVYASAEGLALPSTPGSERETILATLGQLRAGGSTAGGAGIQLAYQIAQEHFITGGTNRVILCTDGDFNVGVTNTADLERMAEEKAKSGVFLTVLGFGRGNLIDAMMEAISNKGNGNYHYLDNAMEARKVLVKQMAGTLVTIAKDVKIQIEFNPATVAGYRLLGYENRILATEDFNDDTKDAGEIGAGHTVTALYELIPAGQKVDVVKADDLKYQQSARLNDDGTSDELLTLKLRYKEPDADISTPSEFAIHDNGKSFALASEDFKFAAAVAGFGLLLRDSQYKGNVTVDAVLEIATEGARRDEHGYREGFLNMVRRAKELGL